VSNDN